jgi:hypothetical protein
MIPAVWVGMPNAAAILFLASVQSTITPVHNDRKKAFTRSASVRTLVGGDDMSMGDIWAEVEWMRRKLDENRLEMLDVIERQKRINGGPDWAGEYESLEGKFKELIKKEDMLRAELARLIAIAVRQRLRGGVGSRENKGHLGWFV